MTVPQKLKLEVSMIQQSHHMVYMQKNWKQSLKKICTPVFTEHYSQCPEGGDNLKCLLADALINRCDRAAVGTQTLRRDLWTRLVRVGGEAEGEMRRGRSMETYITICKIESQWEFDSGNSKWGSTTIYRGGMGGELFIKDMVSVL